MNLKLKRFTKERLTQIQRGVSQRFVPQSGIEEAQGDPLKFLPAQDRPRQLLDTPVDYKGWRNPWKTTMYGVVFDTANVARKVVNGNQRRAYLLIQNQGPGNVWVNFGQDAGVLTSIYLVTTQIYELIGGGSADRFGNPQPNSFVPRDFVSVLTDTAGTQVICCEGVWVFTP
jgi:hypothetical protein